MPDQTSDRRARHTFWIDDRLLDDFSPVLGRFSFGPAAIAVYVALARRADRDGDSWPRLRSIAEQAATSPSTVRRAIRLLEQLGLVEVAARYERGSNRQTSNLYTLLTPPVEPPAVGDDPESWPTPQRRILLIDSPPGARRLTTRAESVADARQQFPLPPFQADRGSPSPPEASPFRTNRGAPASREGQEGNTVEGEPREGATVDQIETTNTAGGRPPVGSDGRRIARILQAAAADPERPPHAPPERWARMTGALSTDDALRIARAGDWERWQEPA
ncbi:MAG TPA: helix-turn-helix domain-containing protein [Thermomicrobiales bacterium]|jgi:DNA-binding MarR family transcriptional regulator|nr:helix-turn-helix domain-containing protein [Thermomicrobiales bacterium]